MEKIRGWKRYSLPKRMSRLLFFKAKCFGTTTEKQVYHMQLHPKMPIFRRVKQPFTLLDHKDSAFSVSQLQSSAKK